MDLKEYDILKKKNNKKDFEQSNKGLDSWLFGLSFLGNALSVFFSIFLVYPGLLKAIEINVIEGYLAKAISFTITVLILVTFEVIKRYVVKNFSNEYVRNRLVIKSTGWLSVSTLVIFLSFYTSLYGSKNLGSIGTYKRVVVENQVYNEKEKISTKFDLLIKPKSDYIQGLIEINDNLNDKLNKTPISWESIKNGYREDIKNNDTKINDTKREITQIENNKKEEFIKLETNQSNTNLSIDSEDMQNIILFIIIALIGEILVLGGIYFREWYEYKLLILNEPKFEKFNLKRDRYRALVTYIYDDNKTIIGDKVISGLELKELVKEKTLIPNSNKFVDEFLSDMDKMNVFNTVGKRRYIAKTYPEALLAIENFEDTLRILENMK